MKGKFFSRLQQLFCIYNNNSEYTCNLPLTSRNMTSLHTRF